jgi:hypothetical protein
MQRVSSNLTIFFKLFVPSVYITFFGLVSIMFLVIDPGDFPLAGNPFIKYGVISVYLFFVVLIYFTLMSLKRVEFGDGHLIVSNYFKTFRYRFEDVERMYEYNLGLFTIVTIVMKAKTKMGRKIRFLAQMKYFNDYLEAHPQDFLHFPMGKD